MATILDFSGAHKFVREQRRMGNDVRWENYDMVFWKPTHHGFTNKKGAYKNGRWGMESRVVVSSQGTWEVPSKNVKSTR